MDSLFGRGLIVALVALCVLLAPGRAFALTYTEAWQNCESSRATFYNGGANVCYDPATTQCAYTGTYPSTSKVFYTRVYKTSCGNPPSTQNYFVTSGYYPTNEDCLGLNDGGVRDKISANPVSTSYCNDGPSGTPPGGSACWLQVDPEPYKETQGRDASGNPVTFYHFHQKYDGSLCSSHSGGPTLSGMHGTDAGEPNGSGQRCVQAYGMCFDANGDGSYCTFNSDGTPSSCVPMDADTDGDGVTDPNDSSPGDPDNGQDSGVGDETDNTSTGGGSCGSPPVSNGDAIAGQIAYQAWATRCAVQEADDGTPSGSACASALTCANMSLQQCFEAGLQKRAACAAEDLATKLATTNTTLTSTNTKIDSTNTKLDTANTKLTSIDGKLSTIATNTASSGGTSGSDSRDCASEPGCSDLGTSSVTGGEGGTGWTTLPGGGTGGTDDSGWLTSRSCPALPSVTVMGVTIDLAADRFCDFMGIGSMLVLIGAALASAKIIGGAI